MCVCVSVFIKLHITAQSGPVILVILCHSLCVLCYCGVMEEGEQSDRDEESPCRRRTGEATGRPGERC